LEPEAHKASAELDATGIPGTVYADSFLSTFLISLRDFDVAVGNPPFLRYQFIDEDSMSGLKHFEAELGKPLARVSNLWIPVFLSSLMRLRPGGVFSFIVPAECLTGISGRTVREWLASRVTELQIEIFPPRSFPGVLQEVVILSGRRGERGLDAAMVAVSDHFSDSVWHHRVDRDAATWTGMTIAPGQLDAFTYAKNLPQTHTFDKVAKLTVATVTGANDFFTYPEEIRRRYSLEGWSRPLLARSRHLSGLQLTEKDWATLKDSNEVAWLLDMGAADETSTGEAKLFEYIQLGVERGLQNRYKCRIRSPWYKVPVVSAGKLLLSKRSHRFPRLMLNEIGAATTDTIYQGSAIGAHAGTDAGIVASFHNSLTLLSSELEGRSFGGGVLELVPSEIGRLIVPHPIGFMPYIADLDKFVRTNGYDNDSLVVETNRLLAETIPELDVAILAELERARQMLLDRRMMRSSSAEM
jgi:adenine-specific DNA-methyltransferase